MEIALVGIGKIALDQHVPAIAASPDWDLAATVSRKGSVDGVESFTDFAELLERRSDIRVVSLCLPPVPRFDYAAAAIAAGRHVMLEKPPGASLSECHRLIDMAQAQRVSLYATWHSREAPMVAAAKAWLADKTLRRLQITWKEDVRRWHPGQDWIWEPGGLGVFDPGINALSILTEILPDAIHLTDATLEVPENKQGPIAASLRFAHPAGAEVGAVFDWRQDGDQIWTIEAETDRGRLELHDGGARMVIDGIEQSADGPALAGEYPRLYARMAQLVASGGSDVDLSPMRHVADAFLLGRRETVAPFHE
ncbi:MULTISPECIES: Gfo/Idh/MocA family protein [Mameliella]|uniref:L-arabinose 1-dehydrogenase n=1 Tax=Mameliella alba TaxID=561184 RepID=A0A0B3SMQ4_9RHOB|nr:MULTISPECIES: Gfo/Idh/MocA family oxidoreductase [Mameliella]MCR9276053.1 Gfo/Idh/MocA family oxidoreductase [Paracoccaceae bacterium]ODM47360.1 D-galactose 1-dehydrogenase [Ruegeria sp. PBVC088]KHQ51814.1 L-arabinose 1-dehydrogenase [Mameliella alba]MDD9731424.1 Gfo/Idh/MocA family oxidoreductase [Mameliella sp. AT18]OWV56866.1 gfo/Idh/MocA family oxidoreductase [Mameliella alba]